ncbi:pilus assembly protein PilM [Clostridium algidicarnis]|uniref:pilus assembly protein PilM n=1 Tax=Clostridium algidicarnis TaxID=37659 RepID=UPI001C0E0D1B|nr:pilus assembly protein PilM [Clostridium algidicarnis]MBU3206710.1 pilus assembly protein PilM [Clostridium algidicarnis]
MSNESIKGPDLGRLKNLLNMDIKSLGKGRSNNKNIEGFFKRGVLSKKLVCFDIGSNSIKVVVGKKKKDKVIIYDAFSFPTPEGALADGKILNDFEISRLIKENIGLHNVKTTDSVCTTNSTTVINREIVVPKARGEEMDTLVNFEIQQYLPINMDNYTVQYNILGEFTEENVERCSVLVITYPNNMAKEYFNLLKVSSLKPYALDVTFNSINKLYNSATHINNEYIEKTSTVAFMDMGSENIDIHIYKGRKLEFTRAIRSAGGDLDGKIARRYDVTLKEAEKRKIKESNLLSDNSSEEIKEFNLFIKEEVQQWAEEIQKIIKFYKNKRVGNKIDKIYIFGGSSRIKGMDTYLEEMLGLTTKYIKDMNNIEIENGTAFQDLDIYLNALGSIIRL